MIPAPVSLAILGAGLIGRRHAEHVQSTPQARLAAIIDPTPAASAFAADIGVPWFESLAAFGASATKPQGIIIATPNRLHVSNGLDAIAAGIPILVEKPIADDVITAEQLVNAAETAGVPLLVGHHRRHNPVMQRAKAIIEAGRLGRIVTVHGYFWLMKPDDYFEPAWRRDKGAGPVFLNMIHDLDLLRYLCGEVVAVQAMESHAHRGHAVEETSVVNLRFASGALGTINVSDTTVAPWSWEHTSGENPSYPHTDQFCYTIGGTHGSLTIPKLEVWCNAGTRSWLEPFVVEHNYAVDQDPLRLQIEHFCRVIRGAEAPFVSGREGLATLKVIAAIKSAAGSGQLVRLN